MRVLLDECVPARLAASLAGHEVKTVRQMRWLGVKNGQLLQLIADSRAFEVFVTMDKNLPNQQKIAGLSFGILILRAESNRLEHIEPLVREMLAQMSQVRRGTAVYIGPTL